MTAVEILFKNAKSVANQIQESFALIAVPPYTLTIIPVPAVEYKTVFHAKLQIVLIQPALSAINAMIISTSATTPASAVE